MERMKALYQKVAGDADLQSKFFEIINGDEELEGNEIQRQLIEFAKEAGFDITIEEMNEFFKELNENQDELSESELDMVAGGKGSLKRDVKELFRRGKKNVKRIINNPETLIH
ncbi:MAG: Nif11-like leader peptide family RiPP precursor [Bacillota bacterium]